MSETNNQNAASELPVDENSIIAERRAKLDAIRAKGIAFPNDFRPTHKAADLQAQYGDIGREELEELHVEVSIGGRMMLKREAGKKAAFATLQDASGIRADGRIQLYVTTDKTGEAEMEAFRHYDLGDILGIEGVLFKTKTDELTIKVTTLRLLTKSLRPLPDKFHGLANQETKYRQRYVDLIMSEETRRTFKARTAAMTSIRNFMATHEFMEVETPMLHVIPGGAAAKPFITHHNALDMELYLRIAPELYLKRLLVGGFEAVYEINRSFRNEGISVRHNPEFTMLEAYRAFTDLRGMMDLTEGLVRTAAADVLGTLEITYQGVEVDLGAPWRRATMIELTSEAAGEDVSFARSLEELRALWAKHEVPVEKSWGRGKLITELFEKLVERTLVQPTFVTDYPLETSPLARKKPGEPELTDRFELIITGREFANAFSELVDPIDQRERFAAQMAAKAGGDVEAMGYDEDYLRAMEYGMPPAGGLGIGIDRLVMLLTDSASIRDVLLFPHLRAE